MPAACGITPSPFWGKKRLKWRHLKSIPAEDRPQYGPSVERGTQWADWKNNFQMEYSSGLGPSLALPNMVSASRMPMDFLPEYITIETAVSDCRRKRQSVIRPTAEALEAFPFSEALLAFLLRLALAMPALGDMPFSITKRPRGRFLRRCVTGTP